MAAWRQIGNAAVRPAGALFALSFDDDFTRFCPAPIAENGNTEEATAS
jgi:hypothetical protein